MADSEGYIIYGRTTDGRKFRPSDWIDRLSSLTASYDSAQRLVYSQWLRPQFVEGDRCLVLFDRLREAQPDLYDQVMAFVHANQLQVKALRRDPSPSS